MIDTNAFLSIGFALVANFTNLVRIPMDSVPKSTNDLEKYVIGAPPTVPLCLTLFDRRGAHFGIHDGVVRTYESPRSYFQSRGGVDLAFYAGSPVLDSNAVVALAASTLQRLAKGTNPFVHLSPEVQHARNPVNGKEIPFYRFTWLSDPQQPNGLCAKIEIDARSGEVTSLSLHHPAFFDRSFATHVSDTVYRPEPTPKRAPWRPSRDKFRVPTTNEVQTGMASWLRLCRELSLNPGADTSLSGINWERSYVYTNHSISTTTPVCQIYFTNGTCFECLADIPIGHYSEDACFTGLWDDRPPEEWRRFRGKMTKKWEDLAKGFEERMVGELGLPQALISSYRAANAYGLDEETDPRALLRCVVRWHEADEDARLLGTGIEPRSAIVAEFDLQSGELKFVSFHDPRLIDALRRLLDGR